MVFTDFDTFKKYLETHDNFDVFWVSENVFLVTFSDDDLIS